MFGFSRIFKIFLVSLFILSLFGCEDNIQKLNNNNDVLKDFLFKISNSHNQDLECEFLNNDNKMESCVVLINQGEISEWKGMPRESITDFNKLLNDIYQKMKKLFNDTSYSYVEGFNFKDDDLFLKLNYKNKINQKIKVYFYKDFTLRFVVNDKLEYFYKYDQKFYYQFYSIIQYFHNKTISYMIKKEK